MTLRPDAEPAGRAAPSGAVASLPTGLLAGGSSIGLFGHSLICDVIAWHLEKENEEQLYQGC